MSNQILPTSKQISDISLLKGAKLPFIILQLCGFFPFSVITSPNKSSISVSSSPWYKSPPQIWLLTLIFTELAPSFIIICFAHNVYKSVLEEFQNQGRNTFITINVAWGLCSVVNPIAIRLHSLMSKGRFLQFWDNFSKLIENFQDPDDEQYVYIYLKYLRIKFILHLISQVTISFVESWIYLSYGISVEGSLEGIGLISSLQDWTFSLNGILSLFWFHGLIYFVSSYNFCMSRLLARLEREDENRNRANRKVRMEKLVQDYIAMDHSVTQFTNLFSMVINIIVVHGLVYLLYCMYFVYISTNMEEYFLTLLTTVQLLIFTLYFYWLANSASSLEENSKLFCKLIKYSNFELDNGSCDGGCGKDLQIIFMRLEKNKVTV